MTGKTRLILSMFLIITTFTTAMSYVARHKVFQDFQDPRYLIATFFGMGIFLSLIVTFVILKSVLAVRNGEVETPVLESVQEPEEVVDSRVVETLSILQKGRLIDFLKENIDTYDDSQIGAAVKNIHKKCKEALEEYVTIEPVMQEGEDEEVTVNKGFDPLSVRLTGNVIGEPPFKGILRHAGWRVSRTKLPQAAKSQDKSIIEPAEVEIT